MSKEQKTLMADLVVVVELKTNNQAVHNCYTARYCSYYCCYCCCSHLGYCCYYIRLDFRVYRGNGPRLHRRHPREIRSANLPGNVRSVSGHRVTPHGTLLELRFRRWSHDVCNHCLNIDLVLHSRIDRALATETKIKKTTTLDYS